MVADATWTSSDPAIVALSADDPPVVTAVAAGTATITAAKAGLSATATVAVMAGTSLPDGTTRWTVPASAGTALGTTIYTHRVAAEVPDFFTTEKAGQGDYDADYTVKAVMADGTIAWTEAAPGVPTFGDEDGGLVATIGDDDSSYPTGLARFAGPAGAAPWRFASTGVLAPTEGSPRPGVAQARDGTIFVAEYPQGTPQYLGDSRIVALDGHTGAVQAVSWLPRVVSFYDHLPAPGLFVHPHVIIGPVVGEDDAAYLAYATAEVEWQGAAANHHKRWTYEIWLRRITSAGVATEVLVTSFSCEGGQTLRLNECTDGQVYTTLQVRQVVPDGVGGVLVRWNRQLWHPNPTGLYIHESQGVVTRVEGTTTTEFSSLAPDERISLVGQSGATYLSTSAVSRVVDAPTFSPQWSVPHGGEPVLAEPSGTLVIHDAGTGALKRLGPSGLLDSKSGVPSRPTYGEGGWTSVIAGAVHSVSDSVSDATRFHPVIITDSLGQARSRQPGRGVFVKLHDLYGLPVKHASIRLVPTDQGRWLSARPDLFSDGQRDEFDNVFATIGAGPPGEIPRGHV